MFSQTRLGTFDITLDNNICFPVGTIFAVCGQYEKLGLCTIPKLVLPVQVLLRMLLQ